MFKQSNDNEDIYYFVVGNPRSTFSDVFWIFFSFSGCFFAHFVWEFWTCYYIIFVILFLSHISSRKTNVQHEKTLVKKIRYWNDKYFAISKNFIKFFQTPKKLCWEKKNSSFEWMTTKAIFFLYFRVLFCCYHRMDERIELCSLWLCSVTN